jgi:uncharacterized protein YigE (DUF2233 family)
MSKLLRPLAVLVVLSSLSLAGCARLIQAAKNEPCALDEAQPFSVVEVEPPLEVRLLWRDADGEPFHTFAAVREHLRARGDSLVAATNAGIYEPGFVPTGLYVEEGTVLAPLNLDDGVGNFFLKPNGVFLVTDAGARVIASTEFDAVTDSVRYATQSGPLLVRDGVIHPAFRPASTNCRLRSGVGVRPDGSIVLAISNGALNFDAFARLFRDTLGAPDALYLDGGISKLYAPGLGREEDGTFAAMLAVVLPGGAGREEVRNLHEGE